jgi:hypothetical protein
MSTWEKRSQVHWCVERFSLTRFFRFEPIAVKPAVNLVRFRHPITDADSVMQLQILSVIRTWNRRPFEILFDGCPRENVGRWRSNAGGPALSMHGGPGVYLPMKGRRPPRGEDSEVPVLEGACLVYGPRRELFCPSTFRAPGPQSVKRVASFPGGGPDALAIHPSGRSRCPRLPGQ